MRTDYRDCDWEKLVVWLETVCSLLIADSEFLYATQFAPVIQLLLDGHVSEPVTIYAVALSWCDIDLVGYVA